MSQYTATHRGNAVTLPGPLALIEAGRSDRAVSWYDLAGRSVRAFAEKVGETPEHVASVLAITSPRVSVAHNVALTRAFFEVGALPPLPASRAALANYLAGPQDPARIRGDKTRNFALAILGDVDAVVVDVWTVRGLGWADRRIGRKVYRKAAATLRALGTRAGLDARDAQAALWYGTRAAYGRGGGQDLIVL